MEPGTPYTLITAAASRAGFELARRYAAEGCNLALVSAERVVLQGMASRLMDEHPIAVAILPCDLEFASSIVSVREALDALGGYVEALVNNLEPGPAGLFWELPIHRQLSSLRLNVEAVLRLTADVLPGMLERNAGRITNAVPMAGMNAGFRCATDHASTAFILAWSRVLAGELTGTGVEVATVRTHWRTGEVLDQQVAMTAPASLQPSAIALTTVAASNGDLREAGRRANVHDLSEGSVVI